MSEKGFFTRSHDFITELDDSDASLLTHSHSDSHLNQIQHSELSGCTSTFVRPSDDISLSSVDDVSQLSNPFSLTGDEAGRGTSAVAIPSTQPGHLLLVALLEHLCTIYVRDPLRSNQLFREMTRQLAQLGIMAPLGDFHEFGSLRAQYRQGFANLIKTAISAVAEHSVPSGVLQQRASCLLDTPHLLPHPATGTPSLVDMLGFHPSRFRDEFCEVCELGRGAFGRVYKARHHLDGRAYAVKKIRLKPGAPAAWWRVLREAKHLASLTHPNIVRYHSAWLEHSVVPFSSDSENTSDTTSPRLPRMQYLKPRMQCVDESTGSSIVFQSSTAVSHEADSGHGEGTAWCSGAEADDESEQGSQPGNKDTDVTDDHCECLSPTNRHFRRMYSLPLESCLAVVEKERTHPLTPDIPNKSLVPVAGGRKKEKALAPDVRIVLYIQMELCQQTLRDWLDQRNDVISVKPDITRDPYSLVDEACNAKLLKQILSGLDYLHHSSLIHRDVKPKNIFLNWLGQDKVQVKLGDFGLSRSLSAEADPLTPSPGLDPGGIFYTTGVGTTIYAAPEQLTGSHYDEKCDLFSLGLILFELYQPFSTEMDRVKTLTSVNAGTLPERFTTRWPKHAAYVRKLTHFDPKCRPSTQELLLSELFYTKDSIIAHLRKNLDEKDSEIARLQAEVKALRGRVNSPEAESNGTREEKPPASELNSGVKTRCVTCGTQTDATNPVSSNCQASGSVHCGLHMSPNCQTIHSGSRQCHGHFVKCSLFCDGSIGAETANGVCDRNSLVLENNNTPQTDELRPNR